MDPYRNASPIQMASTTENVNYIQTRIVAKIFDVLAYPPSLLLQDVSIYTVRPDFNNQTARIVSSQERKKYGLLFSEITYYEPIDNIEQFQKDARITGVEE